MDSDNHFSLITFTDDTKKICTCSAISIFLIIAFIISPLSNFIIASAFMKIVILIILSYTIYLNNKQTNLLKLATTTISSEQLKSQLNINIVCSYVFTLFIGLLIIFIIKSFF
jgi:hypothetical protein